MSPPDGDTAWVGDEVLLVADVPAGTGSVEYFDGAASLGTVSSYPFALLWTATSGSHALSASIDGGAKGAASTVTVSARDTFVPTDATSVVMHIDPADSGNRTITSGRIQTLANIAGTATISDQTQGTATARPVLDKLRGGEAAHYGTGTSEKLTGSVTGAVAQPWVVWTVDRALTRTTVGAWFVAGKYVSINGAAWPRSHNCNANIDLTAAGSCAESIPYIVGGKGNGLSGEVRVNGSIAATGTNGTGTLTGTTYVGGGASTSPPQVHGDMVVALNPSAQDVADIEQYLDEWFHISDTSKSIMFVGDSITQGVGSTDGDGWRRMLWDDYTSRAKVNGAWFEAVGIREDYQYADDQHYGESGKGINYMRANLPSFIGAGNEWNPDVFALMIGTNNARSLTGETYVAGTGAGSTLDEYRLLCIDILTAVTGCKLLVTSIIDINPAGDLTAHDNADAINAGLPAIWDALEAVYPGRIVRWDARAALGDYNATNYSDHYHPNDTGYQILAGGMAVALTGAAA